MLKGIRGRITLLISSLMTLVLLGFGLYLYISLSTQLFRAMDDGLRLGAEQILTALEHENDYLVFGRGDVSSISFVEQDDLLRLLSPAGILLDTRGAGDDVPVPAASLVGGGGFFTVSYAGQQVQEGRGQEQQGEQGHQDQMRLLSIPVVSNGEIVAYLQIGRSLEPIRDTLRRLLALLIIAGPALIAVTAVSGYWLAGHALAPVERIRRQAASISAEDLGQRLNLNLPDDEVGRLARTFDQMLARLDDSFQRQRRFTADASHELRTPLAIIRGEVDVVLERSRSPQEYRDTLHSVATEVERMSRLVANLLLLSRSDSDEMVLALTSVDIADLLHVLVEQMQAQAQATNVTIQLDVPEQLMIEGDTDRLLQLFVNLLENTFIYAPNSTVTVRGSQTGDIVEIIIADTGPGIHPEHLPHIFERFYRVDKARSRSSGGNGLGLAIAWEIARAHGGDISVESTPGQGTAFTVRLPRRSEKY